ncbi:hypothetical protein L7F22_040958 [Adiantum nelumboides]|nr:hypothetical protein [Adiantum nelumboides]
MGEDSKSSAPSSTSPPGSRLGAGDRQLLMSSEDPEDPLKPAPSLNGVSHEAYSSMLRGWVSKKFMSGCVILLPIAITFYVTWWFIQFVDGFFSPIYAHLGINIFGLGFVTSILFIFSVGVFVSSWVGSNILSVGEWFIKRMPLVRHIYSASKQISAAISPVSITGTTSPGTMFGGMQNIMPNPMYANIGMQLRFWGTQGQFGVSQGNLGMAGFSIPPVNMTPRHQHVTGQGVQMAPTGVSITTDQNTQAFKEVAIIRHPRVGEYAFGFITSSLVLQHDTKEEELCSVYVPTNHLYIGDIVLLNSKDIIRPNLSVREGIEIVLSGGMTMPQRIYPLESRALS